MFFFRIRVIPFQFLKKKYIIDLIKGTLRGVKKMKLINVTNSHSRMVKNQLENTDAELVKVYTDGNTTVVYTVAPSHNEILLINKKRNLRSSEIHEVKEYFLKKMPTGSYYKDSIQVIEMPGLVEISIKKPVLTEKTASL